MKKTAQTRKKRGDTQSSPRVTKKEEVIDILHQLLGFRQFLSSGFEPTITDAEIIVCFADVRGFTEFCRKLQKEMQDRKIQNFLRSFFKIFVEGLVATLTFETHQQKAMPNYIDDVAKIARYLVPTSHKGLGDGVMLVWEIPGSMETQLQGILTQHVVYFVQEIEERFYHHFRNLAPVELDSYSKEVEHLSIGFGIAKGHAWRLDFGHTVDYAGSIINLASRLESQARPKGVVAHYDVSPWLFDRLAADGKGKIGSVNEIKGYDGEVKVWRDESPQFDGSGSETVRSTKRAKRKIRA